MHLLAGGHGSIKHALKSRTGRAAALLRVRTCSAAAASDAAAVLLSPAYATIGTPGSPKLVNRQLQLNPFSTLVDEVSSKAGAADLWIAAAVDRHAWAPAAAAAAGLVLGLGLLEPSGLFTLSLPHGFVTALWRLTGLEARGSFWGALSLLIRLPVAAYAARAWLLLQQAIAAGYADALPRLAALQGRPALLQVARAASGSRGLAWGVAIARGFLLCAATSALISCTGAAQPAAAATAAAAAAAATALAFAPQVVAAVGALAKGDEQQQRRQPGSPFLGNCSLLLEAAWAAAAVAAVATARSPIPWAPLAAAAAAAATAALISVHHSLLRPRLASVMAVEGDEATVHVSIRLDSSSAAFDNTRLTLRRGMRVRVGAPPSARDSGSESDSEGSGSSGGGLRRSRSSGELALGPHTLDAAVALPGSHWKRLAPLIEAALPGALLGEVISVPFFNGGGSGASGASPVSPGDGVAPPGDAVVTAPLYRNRELCWWQPLADVKAKFGGQVPEAGEAFLYPVNTTGAWLWTIVKAVGTEHVELDANFGTEGQVVVMEVEVVEILRGQQQA